MTVSTGSRLAGEITAHTRSAGALVLVTDYDGTIAPIAPTPDQAHAVPSATAALNRLGATPGVRLAVITSRSCVDLARRLADDSRLLLIGSAGLERMEAGRLSVLPAVVPWLPAVGDASDRLAVALAEGAVPGARLERKQCGVVVHTRGLHRADADAQAEALGRSVAAITGLRVIVGKRAIELRPPLDIDKGDALAALMAKAPAGAAVVAAGDDLPDVPMLQLAARCPHGVGVGVADSETPEAVREAASVLLDGPWAWGDALAALAARLAPVGG